MASALARRIARLEQGRAIAVPNVVEVGSDETDEQAIERFVARYGRAPSSCIVVPARATDDELADLEPMWADQQRRLVADARTQTRKLKEEGNVKRNARIRTIRNAGSGDGLHSGHRTPDAIDRVGGQRRTVQRRPDSL